MNLYYQAYAVKFQAIPLIFQMEEKQRIVYSLTDKVERGLLTAVLFVNRR